MIDKRYFSDSGALYDYPKSCTSIPHHTKIHNQMTSASASVHESYRSQENSVRLPVDWDSSVPAKCTQKSYPSRSTPRNPDNLEHYLFSSSINKPTTPEPSCTVYDATEGHPINIGIFRHASALYGILVAITATCLTLTAHLTHNVDVTYARWFDCAMLMTGICFLLFSTLFLFRSPAKKRNHAAKCLDCVPNRIDSAGRMPSAMDSSHLYDIPVISARNIRQDDVSADDASMDATPPNKIFHTETDSSSFYMKMGALIFAVGSVIYTSLEIGVFAENQSCFNIVMAMQPCCFTVYLMLQLYFIFRTSKLKISRYRAVCWFGMIHLAATDFFLWIRILIDETQHEIKLIAEKRHNVTELGLDELANEKSDPNYRAPLCVNEESLMKDMLDKASIFLYPCIIEYALITAGVLITMWKIIGSSTETPDLAEHPLKHSHESQSQLLRYSVDCDQATKGLFSGIVAGILSIVGIIIYFVFSEEKHQSDVAVTTFQIMEITLNGLGFLSTLYCMVVFIVKLRHRQERIETAESNLEDALLMICMVGVYTYAVVSLMGSYMVDTMGDILSVTATLLILLEATIQTIFIIGTGKRVIKCETAHGDYKKPAREALTFLILVNFALWAVDVFCLLRTDSSPTQREYFGEEQWAVLLHLSVPLVIFFRFHSTVCLVDIWKRAYKTKRPSQRKIFLH